MSYTTNHPPSVPFCNLVWSMWEGGGMRIVLKVDRDVARWYSRECPSMLFAGALIASLIFLTVRSARRVIVRSITETLGVGTRIETPSSLSCVPQHQADRLAARWRSGSRNIAAGADRGRDRCAAYRGWLIAGIRLIGFQ